MPLKKLTLSLIEYEPPPCNKTSNACEVQFTQKLLKKEIQINFSKYAKSALKK